MGVLSRFALRNPVVIVLILVLVAGSGIYSAFSLHQEDLPDISVPVITVSATYANAPAALVLDSVTKPLEAALSGVAGVQALDSVSAEGISRLVAQFTIGGDARALQRDVQDAVNGVTLPAAVGRPQVTLSSSNNRPVATYSLSGADTVRLTRIAQDSVVPALQGINGVASVDVLGGAPLDVLVTADPAKLRGHNLSIASVDSAIAAGTASQPAGQVTVGGVSMPLRAGNAPDSLAAIRALPIVPATAGLSAALSGAATQGAAGSGGQRATPAQQTAIYLNAARAALVAYEGKNARSGAFGLDTSPTGVAQTDIVQALSDLQQHPTDAAIEARAAERSLLLLARKNSALYGNPNFANALGWLHTANTVLALAAPGGTLLTIGDVATVSLGTPGVGAIARSNGRSGVLVQVTRSGSADVIQLSASVRHALAALNLPPGVHMTKVYDTADTIATSVGGASREGLAGVLLAVIIIGFFLRNWRATLIAVVTVPVAFLLTLIWLNALGLTLNVITLAGFAVATGRVVDDSIVVIENLYRRIARGEAVTRATVQAGVVDVGAAITSSTATTICVFLPLAFSAGLANAFFASFAWTVTVALISSYLAAVTIVPLLAFALFAHGGAPREGGEGAITRRYRKTLAWSLDHRLAVLGVAALTVLLALVVLRRTPTDLFAQSGPASAVVNVTAPLGSTVQATGAASAKVERVIGTDPDVDSYYTTIGDFNQHGIFGASARLVQSNQGSITVNFKDGVDGNAATTHLRDLLSGQYGAAVDVHLSGGANSALEVDVTGSNPSNIGTVTRQVEAAIRAVGGVDNVTDTLAAAKAELRADVDPARAARYGLTPATVVTQLQALVNGVTAAHVSLNGAATDVVVSLAPAALSSPSALGSLPIGTAGGVVALNQIASLHRSSGTALITRHDQQLASRVTGNIISADVGGVSNGIARKLRALRLPGDTQVVLAGASQQQSAAFSSVYSSMAIAVVLVFIVMVLAFRTLAAPVSILFALPVTLIGAALGLALGRQTLGLPALIGLLMLIGIVVTNAIVLMTRVQQYRESGATLRTALLDAGANRLRPILMTAVATIGALLPLSLGFSEGSLISQSLADTVIGGLVSSTVLTLVVVPVVFSLLVREAPPTRAIVGPSDVHEHASVGEEMESAAKA